MNIGLEEYKLKNLTLKSRIVMPPMASRFSDENDHITDEGISYYALRAKKSLVGLIISEHQYINIEGKAHPHQLSIADDSCIESLTKLTDAVHKEGVKIIAQISHAGSLAREEVTGRMVKGPSDVAHPNRDDKFIPMEMSFDDIGYVIKWFTDAALRAKKAGFDGVEIHSAHGYLLNQFYSPLTNKREDEYGSQMISNRIRIHREIIDNIRKEVGEDFIIAIRFGACDYDQNGSTLEDALKAAELFKKSGIDLIDISGGLFGFSKKVIDEAGYFKDVSSLIKEKINVPVMLTGGVTSLNEVNNLLDENDADLIGIGRALMKNAEWYR